MSEDKSTVDMKILEQTIEVDEATAERLNYWLTDNSDTSERLYEDMTLTKTAHFPDGIDMDIKCCGSRDETAWTEAVLFDEGYQCCFSDPSDEFLGDWELDWNGTLYRVHVILKTTTEQLQKGDQNEQTLDK